MHPSLPNARRQPRRAPNTPVAFTCDPTAHAVGWAAWLWHMSLTFAQPLFVNATC
jgi:hypothetical protein